MARKAPFSELRRLVAEEMGVPPEKQRFWRWAQRQNGTYRPAHVLKLESEDQPISVSERSCCSSLCAMHALAMLFSSPSLFASVVPACLAG